MNTALHRLENRLARPARLLLVPAVASLAVCATAHDLALPVTLVADKPNVVSFWNDIANKTVLAARHFGRQD